MFNETVDGIITTMETHIYHNLSDYLISGSSNINNNYYNKNINDNELENDEIVIDNLVKIFGPKRDPLYIVIPITIIYLLILITGIIGNISTCIVISKNKSMHTATNYYLFSLAISDFLLLISGAPQEVYYIWSRYPYIFGELFCIIRGLTAETSANATVLTITAFTVERYVAICHPFLSHTMSKLSRAVRLIILVWIISVSFAIPQALQFGVMTTEGVEQCLVKHVIIQHSFELSSFLFFIAPMTLITVLYILIGLKLRSSSLIKRENGGTLQRRCNINSCRQQNNQGTRRVLKMLVAVVVAFFICWAPFHAQRLVAIYVVGGEHSEPNEFVMKVYDIMTYISGILYYLSTCINPLLYNIMSNKFREAFKATLVKCCHLSKRGYDKKRTYRVLSRSQRRSYGRQESTDCSGNSVRDESVQSSSTQKQSIDSYSLVNQQYLINKGRGNKLNYSHVFDIEECLSNSSRTKNNSDKSMFPFNSGINQSSKHQNNCTPCKEFNNRQMILNLYQNHYNDHNHQHHYQHNNNNHHHHQHHHHNHHHLHRNTSNNEIMVSSNHEKISPVSSASSSSINKHRTKKNSSHKTKNSTKLNLPFEPRSTANLKVIYNKYGELEIIMDNTNHTKHENIDRFAKRLKNIFCVNKSASQSQQCKRAAKLDASVNFIDDKTSKNDAAIVDHLKFECDPNFVIEVRKMVSSNSSDDENREEEDYDDGLDISSSNLKNVNCIDLADELNLYMEEIKMREKR